MTPHKHAEVLRQIADGAALDEFEVHYLRSDDVATTTLWHRIGDIVRNPDEWEIRRKPQHIIVNGFKVPKPLDAVPIGRVYTPALMAGYEGWTTFWLEPENKDLAIQRGIAHATNEAAEAHAKAMLGIDPKWEP